MRPLIAWLLLLPGICWAGDSIKVDPIHKRDRPIVIEHDAGEVVSALFVSESGEWQTLPDDHFVRGETRTILVGPVGQYLLTTGGSTIIKVVDEGRPEPQPKPDPKPGPDPQPNPQPDPEPDPEPEPDPPIPALDVKWAVWVYEQSEAINEIPQTNVRLSAETREYLQGRGIKFAAYDDDQQAARARPYKQAAGMLPALVLMESATKFKAFPAPQSLDELKANLKEVTGE